MTDPIADYLTRIRNAVKAKHRIVEIPSSGVKKNITKILMDQGYILNYKFEVKPGAKFETIKIALKYEVLTGRPAITKLIRVSKPGLRRYSASVDMPRVINGLGVAVVSTSRGVMTDKQARKENVGGEVLCYVY